MPSVPRRSRIRKPWLIRGIFTDECQKNGTARKYVKTCVVLRVGETMREASSSGPKRDLCVWESGAPVTAPVISNTPIQRRYALNFDIVLDILATILRREVRGKGWKMDACGRGSEIQRVHCSEDMWKIVWKVRLHSQPIFTNTCELTVRELCSKIYHKYLLKFNNQKLICDLEFCIVC